MVHLCDVSYIELSNRITELENALASVVSTTVFTHIQTSAFNDCQTIESANHIMKERELNKY